MKKLSLLFCCCLAASFSIAQPAKTKLAVIPEPVYVVDKPGEFLLPKVVTIQAGTEADIKLVSEYLKTKLVTSTGKMVTVKGASAVPPTIKLALNKTDETEIGKEGLSFMGNKKRNNNTRQ